MKENYFIFDMDGTLYPLNQEGFFQSQLFFDIKKNATRFISNRQNIPNEAAIEEFDRVFEKYNGELSLGFEGEYGVDRYTYFENIWNMDPSKYIKKPKNLRNILSPLKGRMALLTAAPSVWTRNVLEYLGVRDLFDEVIYTGEPDLRKPNPEIFRKVGNRLGVPFEKIYSVGDQEFSDIVPAKKLGMKTILVGSKSDVADYCIGSINDLPGVFQ